MRSPSLPLVEALAITCSREARRQPNAPGSPRPGPGEADLDLLRDLLLGRIPTSQELAAFGRAFERDARS